MRKKIYIVIFLAFILLHFSTIYGQEGREFFVNEYRIGRRDLLEIKIFELPELNQTVRVSEDGSITMPLLGKVMVEGLTKDTIEQKLANLLDERYLKNARVSVFIKEYQSKLVAVIGAVEKPGMYEIIGRQNLLQMISKAGGLTWRAGNKLFVLREGKNGITANLSIDLEDLLINGNQKLNIPLKANDVIAIPVEKIIHVFVFGMVKKPGSLNINASKGITLLQAIAQAGGLAEGAKKRGIMIKRKNKSGKGIEIKANLKDIIKGKKPDIELMEGDVVFVPESIWIP